MVGEERLGCEVGFSFQGDISPSASRVLARYLVARQKQERKPIEVSKGYHISPSGFAKKMLEKGVTPKSKGNLGGEFARDKTYFFRSLEDAVESILDRLRESGVPLKFDTREVLELDHAVMEFDLKGMPTFSDPEMPDEAGFTTKQLPAEAISLVDFKKWEPIIERYGKKHKLPVTLPKDGGEKSESSAVESEKPKEQSESKSKDTSGGAKRDHGKKPAGPAKGAEKPKAPSSGGDKAPADWASFLSEVGDQKVANPNPESRKQFPRVKIRSLDQAEQQKYYQRWKS